MRPLLPLLRPERDRYVYRRADTGGARAIPSSSNGSSWTSATAASRFDARCSIASQRNWRRDRCTAHLTRTPQCERCRRSIRLGYHLSLFLPPLAVRAIPATYSELVPRAVSSHRGSTFPSESARSRRSLSLQRKKAEEQADPNAYVAGVGRLDNPDGSNSSTGPEKACPGFRSLFGGGGQ